MTREEAIDHLSVLAERMDTKDADLYVADIPLECVDMAIEELKKAPYEDCIGRQAAIEAVYQAIYNHDSTVMRLTELPSVNPQPKTGHWGRKTKVDTYDIEGVKTWGVKCQCDRCDFTTIVVEDFGYYKYCPNCGAKMEVEECGTETDIVKS